MSNEHPLVRSSLQKKGMRDSYQVKKLIIIGTTTDLNKIILLRNQPENG